MDFGEENILCIKCNEGGDVLTCNENGCPLAIHEGCLGCPARFDDKGNFYCPYCVYKQTVAESRQAREIAMTKKKALLVFMDGMQTGSEENKRAESNKNHNQSNVSASNVNTTTSDAILDEDMISEEEEEEIGEKEHETCVGSKDEEPRKSQCVNHPRTSFKKVFDEKTDDTKPKQSPVKRANDGFGIGKRKRVLWSEDEEEMLKAGVEKYSSLVNKNIPWRKILVHGCDVFHESRTPSDLKDKWRTMSR